MERETESREPKKRREKSESEGEMESAMTSMIDVTFLLLIFFLLTMKFSTDESWLSAHLPTNKGPDRRQVDDPDVEDVRVVLDVNNSGQTLCTVNRADLGANWRERLPGYLASLRQQVPGAKLAIDGNGQVPFDDIAHALNAGRRADYDEVTFAMPQHLLRDI